MQKKKILINYIMYISENFKDNVKFDVILNMEIVEHVEKIELFLNLAQTLKKMELCLLQL